MTWPELKVPSFNPETTDLAEQLSVSPLLAQLLINRKLSLSEARSMLEENPELNWPRPEFSVALQALFVGLLESDAPVAIFGDYDADGLSGTSVLTVFLRSAGFCVTPVLPTRSQGYGLNIEVLKELSEQGHKLLITVDCGISNREEIKFAREQGLAVVVTDHHGLPEILPETNFTLHPAVLEIPELANLSGAGMAYWLTTLLKPAFPSAVEPEQLLDLAVLGTLADMTPLRGLNFKLAKQGLKAASKTRREGLLALARLKKLDLKNLTEDDLTFRMIPLLNAAGRLDSPLPALELLLAESRQEADRLAQDLLEMNARRRELCEDVLSGALELLSDCDESDAIVLADTQWLHGVLGITCSQLVERFHRPVALMAIEGEYAKASVRSPRGYHVLHALQACDDLLERYGGHEMAGGFTISTHKIAQFSQRFIAACKDQQEQVHHEQIVEMEINPELLDLEQWCEIRRLAPFGMGNPHPVFLSLNVPLQDIKTDRRTASHFFAHLNSGVRLKGWRMWREELETQSHFDLVYSLERSEWREQVRLELTVQLLRPHTHSRLGPSSALKSPASAKARTPETASPDVFPGAFFDGKNYWFLPLDNSEKASLWQDWRQQKYTSGEPLIVVRFVSDVPVNTEITLANKDSFDCLALDQPPAMTVLPNLLNLFSVVRLLPLRSLSKPPDFRLLWRILSWLQENGLKLSSAVDLAEKFELKTEQASICLKSLCDLGLLAYDNERYGIQYKNQLYDLRQSVTFLKAQEDWLLRQKMAQYWDTVSMKRLKYWLHAGKVTDV